MSDLSALKFSFKSALETKGIKTSVVNDRNSDIHSNQPWKQKGLRPVDVDALTAVLLFKSALETKGIKTRFRFRYLQEKLPY